MTKRRRTDVLFACITGLQTMNHTFLRGLTTEEIEWAELQMERLDAGDMSILSEIDAALDSEEAS